MLNLVSQEKPVEQETVDFPTFWLLYPRRVAKKDAERAWLKMTANDRFDALVALVDWIRVWKQRGDDQFIPYPASWLNGERWTDELPAEFRQRPQAHSPAKPREETARGEMPQNVRDMIARMKAR